MSTRALLHRRLDASGPAHRVLALSRKWKQALVAVVGSTNPGVGGSGYTCLLSEIESSQLLKRRISMLIAKSRTAEEDSAGSLGSRKSSWRAAKRTMAPVHHLPNRSISALAIRPTATAASMNFVHGVCSSQPRAATKASPMANPIDGRITALCVNWWERSTMYRNRA